MEKILRATRRFISVDNMEIIIEYFSIQSKVESKVENEGEKIVYGIEIVKSIIKNDVISLDEYKFIDAITDSEEVLNYILGKLVSGLVLPIEFLYVMDDLMIEEPFIW